MKDSLSSHFGQLACWVRSHASSALVIASTTLVSRCHIVLLWLFSGHDLVFVFEFLIITEHVTDSAAFRHG